MNRRLRFRAAHGAVLHVDAELDVFVVRELGVPGHEEFATGAIAAGGFEVLNDQLISELGITEKEIAAVAENEAADTASSFFADTSPRLTSTAERRFRSMMGSRPA